MVTGGLGTTVRAQMSTRESNPSFVELVGDEPRAEGLPQVQALIAKVSKGGLDTRGTEVAVPTSQLETTEVGTRPVLDDKHMKWHNPLGPVFGNATSSRWYQRHGNTQVFRVFPGDENWSSKRPGAARSEAFVGKELTTVEDDGKTLTFTGRFHVASHNGSRDVMLFQSKGRWKNTKFKEQNALEWPAWSVALFVQKNGEVVLRTRKATGGKGETVKTGFKAGESFDLRVVDDGLNFQAFINDEEMLSGQWKRGDTETVARWGIYVQQDLRTRSPGVLEGGLDEPQVVFVSGANVSIDPS